MQNATTTLTPSPEAVIPSADALGESLLPGDGGGATAVVPEPIIQGDISPAAAAEAPRTLQDIIHDFAAQRIDGWDHGAWLGLLDDARREGHEIADEDAIGVALERERLTLLLRQVPGLGKARINALAERYGSVWALQQATEEEIAALPGLTPQLADRVVPLFRR